MIMDNKKENGDPFSSAKDSDSQMPHRVRKRKLTMKDVLKDKSDNILDRICRIVFPTLFVLFNILYWSIIMGKTYV